MKFKITRVGPTGARDLLVTADVRATVADVAARLDERKRDDPGGVTLRIQPPGASQGVVLDPAAPVHESSLRSGCRVEVVPVGERRPGDELDDAPAALIRVLSGPGDGREFRVAAGVNLVGRDPTAAVFLDADHEVSRRHATITVAESIVVTDLGSANGVLVDGLLVRRAVVTAASRIRVGTTELAVVPLRSGRARASRDAPDAFVRPPRVEPVFGGRTVALPEPPAAEEPSRLPVVALIAPAVLGAALFLVTRQPMSLLFVLLSPLMLVGSWLDTRLRWRRAHSARRRSFDVAMRAARRELLRGRDDEVAARREEAPSAAEVIAAMRTRSTLLWSRHPSGDAFLRLRLGSGTLPSRGTVAPPVLVRASEGDREAIGTLEEEFAVVPGVPVVEGLHRAGALGVAGAGPLAAGAARALVVQAAGLHSPADLAVAAIVGGDARREWEWLTWLPHVDSPHSPLRATTLVSDAGSADRLLLELEALVSRRRSTGRTPPDRDTVNALPFVLVVVAPGAPADRSRLVALADEGRDAGIVMIWTAEAVTGLPAACTTFLDVDRAEGGSVAGFVTEGRTVALHEVESIDPIAAETAARAIAPLTDIGARVVDETDLPGQVAFLDLYGAATAADPAAVVQRWARNDSLVSSWTPGSPRDPGGLLAVVGQGREEAFAIDLRADGPHALVGGTTGSGKSEFLQTWLMGLATEYSPDRVNFLLVDYKGGAAFAECADLPHTVGLVTDLTPSLVHRALVSLRAELSRRERILSRANAKDVTAMEAQGDPEAPPSLLIVVDEFATLAAELPEFVDGVVDIAQRGRSLALHLVLATQRPSGVIKDSLRANTDLRIALRVADAADSVDVVGVPDAARFDRRTPGRAMAARGGGRLHDFQAAYLGGRVESSRPRPAVRVQTLEFGPGEDLGEPVGSGMPEPTTGAAAERRLDRLVRTIARAADDVGAALPRRPWVDQLAESIDLGELPEAGGGSIVLGLRDEPRHQRQRPLAIDLDSAGNLLVVGGGGAGASAALRTVAAAATKEVVADHEAGVSPPRQVEVHALDYAGGGLALLDGLPTVGSVVVGSDLERVDRLLRDLATLVAARAALVADARASSLSEYESARGETLPRVVLLLDGFAAFRAENELRDAGRPFDRLVAIMANGRRVGVHVALSADRDGVVPASLSVRLGARIVLGGAASDSFHDPPGRGRYEGEEIQLAVPGGSPEPAAQGRALEALASRAVSAGVPAAPPVRRLDALIARDRLPATVRDRPVIGVGHDTLEPVGVRAEGLFVVAGPFGSGRTTAMRTAVRAIVAAQPRLQPRLLSARDGGLADAVPWLACATGPAAAAAEAARLASRLEHDAAFDGARLLLVVESIGDFEGHAAEGEVARLVKAARRSGAIVLAEADTMTAPTAWQLFAELKAARAGLILQPDESDAIALFRTPLPRLSRSEMPPGRGFLIEGGHATLLQVAVTNTSKCKGFIPE